MASPPRIVWRLTTVMGMSRRPAPGASGLASRRRVRTTRTTARTSRIVEMTLGSIGSLWRTRGRTAPRTPGAVDPVIRLVTRLVELRGEQLDQRIDLAGPVAAHGRVEPERAQVVARDRSLGGEAD